MLGGALCRELEESFEVVPRTRDDYDIRDTHAFERDLEKGRPQAVVNCAAYTAVDKAEEEQELVMEVNAGAPARMARACKGSGVAFVQMSSDYVFDGAKTSPYLEEDEPKPLNVYGASKLAAERAVASADPEGRLVIRTSGLFGPGGRNFVNAMLEECEQGTRSLRVVADQHTRVTYAPDLARAIRVCLEKGLSGIYHAANAGETTWYEFALLIFRAAGVDGEVSVEPVSTGDYGARASRPLYSVLDTGRLEREAGVNMPDFKDALSRCLAKEKPLKGSSKDA